MAENGNNNNSPPSAAGGGDSEQPRDENQLSLEQALLAPLNSILKAQLHSARSFLNLLLQLGYPHSDGDELPPGMRKGEPFHMEFRHYDADGKFETLRVPALSLVPIAPLAVESATFELEMAVKKVSSMTQMQKKRQELIKEQEGVNDPDARPWFLVDKPVTIEGAIAPPSTVAGQQRNESQSSIKIAINIKSIPMPSGLDKLLTTLTHMSEVLPPQDPELNTTGDAPSSPAPAQDPAAPEGDRATDPDSDPTPTPGAG